jgi:RNA polymerase sigma factor (sigma-70 family)
MELTDMYKRFRKPLRVWLDRRGVSFSGVDVDDVVQEVFERLMRYPVSMENESYRATYLFRVASNVVSNYRELAANRYEHAQIDRLMADGVGEHDGYLSIGRSESGDPGDAIFADESSDPLHVVDLTSLREFVCTTVDAMPLRTRQIFMMFVIHDLSHKEIASRLGVTLKIVNNDLMAAYKALRERLS